jgi:hypothetical protein
MFFYYRGRAIPKFIGTGWQRGAMRVATYAQYYPHRLGSRDPSAEKRMTWNRML